MEKENNTEQSTTTPDANPSATTRGARKRRNSYGRSSSTRRHKPKRAKAPIAFNEWCVEDQARYNSITIELRRWKAAARQSQYIRQDIGRMAMLKNALSPPSVYKDELKCYRQVKKTIEPVPKGESFDLPRLEGIN